METVLRENWLLGAADLRIAVTDEFLNKVSEIRVLNGQLTTHGHGEYAPQNSQ
jgi:hypothetical protein